LLKVGGNLGVAINVEGRGFKRADGHGRFGRKRFVSLNERRYGKERGAVGGHLGGRPLEERGDGGLRGGLVVKEVRYGECE